MYFNFIYERHERNLKIREENLNVKHIKEQAMRLFPVLEGNPITIRYEPDRDDEDDVHYQEDYENVPITKNKQLKSIIKDIEQSIELSKDTQEQRVRLRVSIYDEERDNPGKRKETPPKFQIKSRKINFNDKLKDLKVIYTTPVKFVNYQFNYSEDFILSPDFIEILIKKIFTEARYRPLIKDARRMAEKTKFAKSYNITNYLKVMNQFIKNLENACIVTKSPAKKKSKLAALNRSIDSHLNTSKHLKQKLRRKVGHSSKVETHSDFDQVSFNYERAQPKNDPITAFYRGEHNTYEHGESPGLSHHGYKRKPHYRSIERNTTSQKQQRLKFVKSNFISMKERTKTAEKINGRRRFIERDRADNYGVVQ
ncbi:unnamed protein product [Moneuplotes crassus]|uniref:Uncharacterized protein n=1 Tax=Euplotes crassus TaxID=5936 RepID=A0AAD1UPG2_EUPCR|nr:unnamed protein product [Moneuplotes crassus]